MRALELFERHRVGPGRVALSAGVMEILREPRFTDFRTGSGFRLFAVPCRRKLLGGSMIRWRGDGSGDLDLVKVEAIISPPVRARLLGLDSSDRVRKERRWPLSAAMIESMYQY